MYVCMYACIPGMFLYMYVHMYIMWAISESELVTMVVVCDITPYSDSGTVIWYDCICLLLSMCVLKML